MSRFWNERYQGEEYVYGEQPNTFFAAELSKLTPGRILLPGEGEGRNAVYAARCGWLADAVDFSEVAREKALRLAAKQGVRLNYYELTNLEHFIPDHEIYDAVALIFVHLEPEIRHKFHQHIAKALKPGGHLIAEFFSVNQIGKSSGGPQNPLMLYRLNELIEDFNDLEIKFADAIETQLDEGAHHRGAASVIRLLAKKGD